LAQVVEFQVRFLTGLHLYDKRRVEFRVRADQVFEADPTIDSFESHPIQQGLDPLLKFIVSKLEVFHTRTVTDRVSSKAVLEDYGGPG